MTTNEIKKALYKDKPVALFSHFRKGILHYSAELQSFNHVVQFEVPTTDTGDADFLREMEAKHLIRYLVN